MFDRGGTPSSGWTGLFGLLTLFAVACLLLAIPRGVGAVNPYGPTYRYCSSFRVRHLPYRIRVYETQMRCRKARKIQKEYWLGPKRRKIVVHGGVGAFGYVLLKRFPGWKCYSGAGGGECVMGEKVASYQD